MAETFCGRSCTGCTMQDALGCPGCMQGPGRSIGSDCALAKCCRRAGHESCQECIQCESCKTLQERDQQAEKRKAAMDAQRLWKEKLTFAAPSYERFFTILLLLLFPETCAGALILGLLVLYPWPIFGVQIVLAFLGTAAYGLTLLRMGKEEGAYRIAGYWALVSLGIMILFFLFLGFLGFGDGLIFLLLHAVASLVAKYQEFKGHASLLFGTDNLLSTQWPRLWFWRLGFFLAILSPVILVVFPVLQVILMAVGSIGVLGTTVIEGVYLFRSGKAFRTYGF